MSRRLTDMRWDTKGNPANLQAATADALLWLDRMEKLTLEKRKLETNDLPALIRAREQLEKHLSVDARTKGMP